MGGWVRAWYPSTTPYFIICHDPTHLHFVLQLCLEQGDGLSEGSLGLGATTHLRLIRLLQLTQLGGGGGEGGL